MVWFIDMAATKTEPPSRQKKVLYCQVLKLARHYLLVHQEGNAFPKNLHTCIFLLCLFSSADFFAETKSMDVANKQH
jgi:hypothetical protein